jgi:carbamoyl-phosphate synthase large subunit
VKFQGVDILLGPEMRSTGEVMGIDTDFGRAYAKSQAGAGMTLPGPGGEEGRRRVVISVNDKDKAAILEPARRLVEMGFELFATNGTFRCLQEREISCQRVFKMHEGRPNIVDLMKNKNIALVINTPMEQTAAYDERTLRRAALEQNVPYVTTLSAAHAAVLAIASDLKKTLEVKPLQDYYKQQVYERV